MKRSGTADLPLHYGRVPLWLAERMARLGGAVVESILLEYGSSELLRRLSDPYWFQALGCVMGMDWHSSGITTAVLGALKRDVNPRSDELGIHICGGKGSRSRGTPQELETYAERTGLNGDELVTCSRLSARVDNNAVQDGFQIYLHTFIVSRQGEWTVVQQGLNAATRTARRYHWHSARLMEGPGGPGPAAPAGRFCAAAPADHRAAPSPPAGLPAALSPPALPPLPSFVREPHAAVVGTPQGAILNLVHREADPTQRGIVSLAQEDPGRLLGEIRRIVLPAHHEVLPRDVDLKRLGAVLALAHDRRVRDFASLLLTEGLGPRTLLALTLVSEVIHGTPSRFSDPARFAFAHGGKDGHPFPVPLGIYDRTIETLKESVNRARIGRTEKMQVLKRLSEAVVRAEEQPGGPPGE